MVEDIQFRVFVGAPCLADLRQSGLSFNWQTVSSTSSVTFPQATLEAASRRISLIYQNIIFDNSDGDQEALDENITQANAGMSRWLLIIKVLASLLRTKHADFVAANRFQQ